jgi:hypothetical protein
MARNMIVEVYGKTFEKKCWVARAGRFDEIATFLKPLISPEYADSVVCSLKKQSLDPAKFPNVILFLEGSGDFMSTGWGFDD